jgi:hypothetical protein
MAPGVLACLVLAAVSLLGPSEPSYDPWAWLVWGREIVHFSLDTTGGPSWKPLPVVFTTMVAPLSKLDDGVPVALWMVVARAGGLVALLLAFRVASRITGGGTRRRLGAGATAAVAVALIPGWGLYLLHGNEAPLAIALALLAIDQHLEGRRRTALALGGLVCLARPELFGFLFIYGAHLWRRSPDARPATALVFTAIPAAWVIPSWIGAGDPLMAGKQARSEPSWSLSLVDEPWRAALELTQSQTLVVMEASALIALALSLAGARRSRPRLPSPARPRVAVALACFALGIAIAYAAMTEVGFSGNVRYVLPALGALAVLGGVGVGMLCDVMATAGRGIAARAVRGRRPAERIGGVLSGCSAVALLALAGAAGVRDKVDTAKADIDQAIERSHLHADLEQAIDRLGPRYITTFGPSTANRALQTHLAWSLSLPLNDVPGARGEGMLFRTAPTAIAGVVRVAPRARERILVASVGDLSVSVRPLHAQHLYTWPIVGFRLRTAAARLSPHEQAERRRQTPLRVRPGECPGGRARVPGAARARRGVKLHRLEPSVAVRGLHHRDLCPDAIEVHEVVLNVPLPRDWTQRSASPRAGQSLGVRPKRSTCDGESTQGECGPKAARAIG